MSKNQNIEKRRNFFKYLGAGAIGTGLLSLLPFNFAKNSVTDTKENKIKVSIHPSAIKRG